MVHGCRFDRARATALVVALALLVAAAGADGGTVSIRKVEALEGPQTVVKIHLSAPLESPPRTRVVPKAGREPDRIAIDLPGAELHGKTSREVKVGWGGVRRLRLGMPSADAARVVLELDRLVDFDVVSEGDVVNVTLGGTPAAAKPSASPATPPK